MSTQKTRLRYFELRKEGYFCPRCRTGLLLDRALGNYFCPKMSVCGFSETRDQFAITLRDNLRTTALSDAAHLRSRTTNAVYYIRFRDVIKIGTSLCAPARINELPCEEILALEPGDRIVESERHRRFADTRVLREWFEDTPELRGHIKAVRLEHADWVERIWPRFSEQMSPIDTPMR